MKNIVYRLPENAFGAPPGLTMTFKTRDIVSMFSLVTIDDNFLGQFAEIVIEHLHISNAPSLE